MITSIKKYFPESKQKWWFFIKIAVPVTLASMLYALNGVIDNFMVGKINGGTAALAAANSWTAIIMGIYIGIGGTAAILFAQYWAQENYQKTKEIMRIRVLLNVVVSVCFFTAAQIDPKGMVKAFAGTDEQNLGGLALIDYLETINQGQIYIRLISVTWVIIALTYTFANIFREVGFTKISLIAGVFGLLLNILLNALLIEVFHFDTAGAAYASIAARLIVLAVYITNTMYRKHKFKFNVLTIFQISKETWIEILKRSARIVFASATFLFINLRNVFWNVAYPAGTIGSEGALAILGVTSAIINVFLTAFSAANINAAIFVGSELGKNNLELAKKNSDQLKGFHFVLASFFSLILFTISFTIPYMTFLHSNNADIVLTNVKYSLWIVALFYPWWIWFRSSFYNMQMGGKVTLISILDSLTSGPMQLAWLAIQAYVIIPQSGMSFVWSYLIFFISDIPRGIVFEILYLKMDWAKNITKNKLNEGFSLAHENTGGEYKNME